VRDFDLNFNCAVGPKAEKSNTYILQGSAVVYFWI